MVNTLLVAFLEVYGEPQVERAITFETQIDETKAAAEKAKGMDMADGQQELVSRSVQAGIGLFVAVVYIALPLVDCSDWRSPSPMGAWERHLHHKQCQRSWVRPASSQSILCPV